MEVPMIRVVPVLYVSPCPLGELAEKKKEMPQCCCGIPCAGHAIALAKPGYQPFCW